MLLRAAAASARWRWRRCSGGIDPWPRPRPAQAGAPTARPLPDPVAGQERHLPVHGGGPSSIDLFDPKPKLNELAGKPLPASFKPVITPMGEAGSALLASRRKWAQHGRGGLWVSDWLPHIAGCADDLAVIRSCWSNGLNHVGGVCQMNTGSILAGRPCLGSWVSYGLGAENQNLPAFVVLLDNPGGVVAGGPRNWGAGFMPAAYQGTRLQGGPEPIPNLARPRASARTGSGASSTCSAGSTAGTPSPGASRPSWTPGSRATSWPSACRPRPPRRSTSPSRRPRRAPLWHGRQGDGHLRPQLPAGPPPGRARRALRPALPRRRGEVGRARGHREEPRGALPLDGQAGRRVAEGPEAARALDETLVVWGGEFGRTPMSEKGDGRDHNPYGFTMWMAGGGVQGGQTIGATDEVGLHAVEDRLHVHDLHATILHLLGVDHTRLVYLHKGRPERATLNEGNVYERIATG
jgi:hypothetical protein